VNSVPDIFRILPEVILTLTGVAVMLIDASLPPGFPRRPLGWIAALGTTIALWASLWQLSLPQGTGYYGTVETSAFTIFFHVLICGIVLVALLLSLDTLPEDSHHQGEYYALVVFGAVGMCLLTGAVELLLVFVALEISSISTYILAGYRKNTGRGPEAAIKYFLLGSFATAFLLYGVALIFGATGTTQIYQIARLASSAQNHSFVLAGMALMLVGILFKVSAAPFHVWTPDVYEGAPSPVVALLSTAPKTAAFALLLRVVYELFPSLHGLSAPLLWVVAVLSMTVGNLAALRQQNVKRMLAYSSIAHAGYLLAAFAGVGTSGIAAASFYTAAYAAMNVGIFAVITVVSGYDEDLPMIENYRGLIYRSPLLGSLLIFFLVSLVGIPFTGGFFGKFYSFSAAVNGGAVWLAIIGLLNSGLAAAYYLRLALVAAQRANGNAAEPAAPAPRVGIAVGAALLFAVAATLILGIVPGEVLRAAEAGAHTLQAPPQSNTSASAKHYTLGQHGSASDALERPESVSPIAESSKLL
jgi:NADH-quinone oxidoreductase subunit N